MLLFLFFLHAYIVSCYDWYIYAVSITFERSLALRAADINRRQWLNPTIANRRLAALLPLLLLVLGGGVHLQEGGALGLGEGAVVDTVL